MSQYDIYTFILCLIVFLLLTSLLSFLLAVLVKLCIHLVHYGHDDETLLKEYEKSKSVKRKKRMRFSDIICTCFSICVCVALFASFAFSVYLQATNSKAANGVPSLKVVKSDSMSYANEKNTYLAKNGIQNHLQTFDLIVTEHLPDEFDLKLYDIVVYELEGEMIIHRIVGIEEPNEKHPGVRHFLLQGDAIQYPDNFPVLYSQMRGIYNGTRVPFVGSFILFLQSPAGWLCILLILIAIIVTPIAENRFRKAKEMRLALLLNGRKNASGSSMPLYVGKGKKVKPIAFDRITLSHFHMSLEIWPRVPKIDFDTHYTNHVLRKREPKE